MNKSLLLGSLAFMFFNVASPALAELFRWTDADGKVHYSDRKPTESSNAKAIDDELTPINIDDSKAYNNGVGKIFPKEDKSHRAFEDKKRQKQQAATNHACTKAREYLRKISGRVRFIDDDGKPVNVSEADRKKRKIEVEKDILKNC